METTPYWQKVWYTICGQSAASSKEDVVKLLQLVEQELCTGILQFKTFSFASFNKWKEVVKLDDDDRRLETFVKQLSIYLDLETSTCWKIFCNFLMFEYFGKIDDIKKVVVFEMYLKHLYQNIWMFYTSERMFMIQTIKHILECYQDENHRYYSVYQDFVNSISLVTIRTTLLNQFRCLINEINDTSMGHCYDFSEWVERNMREQRELLFSVILTIKYMPLAIGEFKQLFHLFKEHNFTQDPKCFKVSQVANQTELTKVKFIEIGILLVGLTPCWENTSYWHGHAAEIEELILNIIHQGQYSIILMAWATLQMTLPEKIAIERYKNYYHSFTDTAIKQHVFKSLYEVASNSVFKGNKEGKLIRNAVYELLDYICVYFDTDGSVLRPKYADTLLGELISTTDLMERCVNSKPDRAVSLYNTAAQLFPYTFYSYTTILNALIKYPVYYKQFSDGIKYSTYVEEYTERYFASTVTIMSDYKPTHCGTIVIPARAKAKVFQKMGKYMIAYPISYSYLTILEDRIYEVVLAVQPTEAQLNDMYISFRLLKTILRNPERNLDPLQRCFALVGYIFTKFTARPFANLKVVEACLDVYVELMSINDEQIVEILSLNNFLPILLKDYMVVRNYFEKTFFQPGILLTAIKQQVGASKYTLLFSYIDFLKEAILKNNSQKRIQIPGLVFIFLHIFPEHLDWQYSDNNMKYELTYRCLKLLFEILKLERSNLEDVDLVIYDFCHELITNYDPFLIVYLRLFRTSNIYLHAHLDRETYVLQAETYDIIKVIKLCLGMMLLLIKLHKDEVKFLCRTKFEALFFDNSVKPSCVKVIVGYINNVFDKGIPKVALQILKKLAVDPTFPMLSLLEMDHYQIQNMFLEKLRDPLEDDIIKVAIIDLITLCVETQNGMTSAFFDISRGTSGNRLIVGESIVSFMDEYLKNIKQSIVYVNSPIQIAIINLFHMLWVYRKDILIRHLKSDPNFWSTLADPLFRDLKLSNKTYAQIFNIYTYEIFQSRGEHKEINEVIDRLFLKEVGLPRKWTERIVEALEEPAVAMHGTYLLTSWKHFIVAVCKNYPVVFEDLSLRQLIAANCLEGLIQHFLYPDDIRVITIWIELYMYLINQWPTTYYRDPGVTFASLTKVYAFLDEYYAIITNPCKQAMFTVATRTVQNLHMFIDENQNIFSCFLHSVGKAFEKEYYIIMSEEYQLIKDPPDDKKFTNWLLLLIFGNNLLKLGIAQSHPNWFRLSYFLHKILTSISPFVRNPVLFSIGKIAMQCLINYAQTPLIFDFLHYELEAFFELIKPPKRYIEMQKLTVKTAIPWYFEEFWLTYTGVTKLANILLRKFGLSKLDTFFTFVSLHDDIIKDALRLPRVTAEFSALQLVGSCLTFLHSLLKWKQLWKIQDEYSYNSYLDCINETVNAVTGIFIRPKVLKFFEVDVDSKMHVVECIPVQYIVNIMNQLLEILGYCSECLVRSGPPLIDLVDPTKLSFADDVIIEYGFHVPKVIEERPEILNYGTVLCILHFLCKTVTQIHQHKPAPEVPDLDEDGFSKKTILSFVCPDSIGSYTVSERFNSVQRFAAFQISGMSAPWLTKLDLKKVNFALETLNTYLASQVYLTMFIRYFQTHEMRYVKRELISELLFFHEFIRKRMVEKHSYRVIDNMVYRRPMAGPLPYQISPDDPDKNIMYVKQSLSSTLLASTVSEDDADANRQAAAMNLDYLRYRELQSTFLFSPDDFEVIYAPVNLDVSESPMSIFDVRGVNRAKIRKWFYGRRLLDSGGHVEIPVQKIVARYPPIKEFVDGDYLLYLSHWFTHICNLTHSYL